MLYKYSRFTLISFFTSLFFITNLANAETAQLATVIKPFTASYSILHKSDPVGTGVRQLKYLSDGNIEYSYHSKIKWLIYSDSRKETSIVSVMKNKIMPKQYSYVQKSTLKDKKYQWQYDIENNQATNMIKNKQLKIDFPSNIQDKLSYHLQHRLTLINNPEQKRFVYPVISTSGAIKNYVYQYDGKEEIMLPYGLVKTIRLKREVIEKKRATYVWFAPELNYLLVKLYQVKSGVEQFEVQLVDVKTDD